MLSSSIGAQLPFANIIINLIVASLLGGCISLVYIRTHKGFSFSQSFTTMLVLTTVISTIVMMVIGNNLARAFGLVGAFSIIRFRTAVKEIRDMVYIFLTVVVGMAIGSNNYSLGVTGVIVVALLTVVLDRIPLSLSSEPWYLLSLHCKKTDTSPVEKIMRTYVQECVVLTITTTPKGSGIEILYHVKFKQKNTHHLLLAQLQKTRDVFNPHLSLEQQHAQY